MQIRDGQPIELQFADKPAVTFTTPPQGKVFRPGDAVPLKAMLKDAGTGMLLRGLYDTTKTTQQPRYPQRRRHIQERADLRITGPDRHDCRCSGQRGCQRPDAVWVRRHMRVLVASAKRH